MMSTVFATRLIEKIPRAGDIVSFRFERPEGYEYLAGQWHVVTIPVSPEPLTHHFTHSSSPTEPFLEFTTRMRGTQFKNALGSLPLGVQVEMEGPFGSFTLATASATATGDRRPLVFITGGIGITPVRSILRWQVDTGSAQPEVLLYANSSENAIAFRDELDGMAATSPDIRVVHIVSRPSPAWIGRQGHVDAEMLADELGDVASHTYYVSGPPPMVLALRDTLVAHGVDRDSVKTELFEGYQ